MNKTYSVKKQPENEFWVVIDCGETKDGGMVTGNFWRTHFKKDGRTYRWFNKLFDDGSLKDWEEISVKQEMICRKVDSSEQGILEFEEWEDKDELALITLQDFAKLLGKNLSLEEISKLIS
jgi:hypothetical protein